MHFKVNKETQNVEAETEYLITKTLPKTMQGAETNNAINRETSPKTPLASLNANISNHANVSDLEFQFFNDPEATVMDDQPVLSKF